MTNATISPKNKIDVSFDKVEYIEDGSVAISGKPLIESLIKYPQETLESLSKNFAPITLNDINLDDKLSVIVTNTDFIKKLKDQENTQTQKDDSENTQTPENYSSNTLCVNAFC